MHVELKKIKRYWTVVFREAVRILGGEIRSVAIGIVVAFLLACISTIAFFFNLVPTSWVDQTWEEAVYVTASGCISVNLLLIALFFVLAYLPAKIYEKQGGFIEIPFELSSRPPLSKHSYEHRWASVTVKNISNKIIKNCFVTLDDILDKNNRSILFSRQRRLSWSSGEGLDGNPVNKELDIIPNEPRIGDVATTWPNNTEVLFTAWRGGQTVPKGVYKIVVTAHGQWEEKTVEKTKNLILEYTGGNDLSIRDEGEKKWQQINKLSSRKNKRDASAK